MYQLYAVQKINDKPYNVILGKTFATVRDAEEAANAYELYFGKCERFVCEPAGREIPVEQEKKKTVKEMLKELFK